MSDEAMILKAICETMLCDKCPLSACEARQHGSLANCVYHWSEALSKIKPDTDWEDVRFEVSRTCGT